MNDPRTKRYDVLQRTGKRVRLTRAPAYRLYPLLLAHTTLSGNTAQLRSRRQTGCGRARPDHASSAPPNHRSPFSPYIILSHTTLPSTLSSTLLSNLSTILTDKFFFVILLIVFFISLFLLFFLCLMKYQQQFCSENYCSENK